jgi:hypothetical protein
MRAGAPGVEPRVDLGGIEPDDIRCDSDSRKLAGAPAA